MFIVGGDMVDLALLGTAIAFCATGTDAHRRRPLPFGVDASPDSAVLCRCTDFNKLLIF